MPRPESSYVTCTRKGCGHPMVGGHEALWDHGRNTHTVQFGACLLCACPEMKHPGFWRYLWQQFSSPD